MAGVLESLARGLRQAGGVISPDVQKTLAAEGQADDAMRRQVEVLQLQQRMADEREKQLAGAVAPAVASGANLEDIGKRLLTSQVPGAAKLGLQYLEKARELSKPKEFAPPEVVQIQAALDRLPAGDPRRGTLQARLTQLTTRPDKPESVSPIGRLIAERDALPADDPRRKFYDDALAKQGQPGGVNVTVSPTLQLGKEASNKVDTGLLDTTKGVMTLSAIESQYRPEFQQYIPRLSAGWSAIKDKLGVDLNPDDRKFLQDFSAYKRNSINAMNEYIKSITGAAMSEQEAQRILKGMPSPGQGMFDGDSPTEFRSKLDDAMKQTKMALARYEYIKRNGIALTDSNGRAVVPLERMPEIMNERGRELEAQLTKAGEKDVQGKVRGLLAKEFGLVR